MSITPYPSFEAAFEAVRTATDANAAAMRVVAEHARRLSWSLKIAFAETPRDARRARRDMARAYRRPALIHKGRKP